MARETAASPGALSFGAEETPAPAGRILVWEQDGLIVVAWDNGESVVDGYNVYRAKIDGELVLLNSKPVRANYFVDDDLSADATDVYFVECVGGDIVESGLNGPSVWIDRSATSDVPELIRFQP